ncbi:MAG: LytTR family transcriptional regulator DNA-binding domain-containing protein [Candidatus Kapabacteria bacterium]|nr:LytTR family transcriptional regulator DNA-binding domain-containing protein [Candidatus Kapabacteria bacterium]
MSEFKLLIVEDEEPARLLLKKYVSEMDDIELIGECTDGFAGVKSINELKPDIVILDINMPKLTGLELLEVIEHKPAVIFSTAYDQYAIAAFEKNAVDYIMKPYSKARLRQALDKACKSIDAGNAADAIDSLVKNEEPKAEPIRRVAVKNGTKIFVIPIEKVDFIEADGDYVKVHTGESTYLKEKTMRFFEMNLSPDEFVRVHRSFIINVNEISKVEPYDKDSHVVILRSGKQIKTSVAGYKALKNCLGI